MPPADDGIPAWRRYLRFTRANPIGDVSDELTFHLQSTVDELMTGGMSRDAAIETARLKFGDVDTISKTLNTLSQERERTMERNEWWQTIRQDTVFALRQLRKSPGFTFVALLTLGLGIGANSAIFSVLDTVLLKPLPYANGDRLVRLWEKVGDSHNAVTFGNYGTWLDEATSFDALGATWGGGPETLTGVGDPIPMPTISATATYWKAMYIAPILGRYFGPTDDREGAAPVVVLSAALWQNRFASDSAIVGKNVMLGGVSRRVVGVASPQYVLGPPAERAWTPLLIPAARFTDHADHELSVYGLVRRGVPVNQAVRELSRIETRLAKEFPHSGFDDVYAQSLIDAIVGDQRLLLVTLMGAVGLVLLIACANVANLLIARATSRRGEIAIRGALGASHGRIVGQLLVESVVIALAGGVLGLAVAFAGIKFLVTSPARIPRLQYATLDGTVVAFTLLLALGCAVVFGLIPALRAARLDLQQTLRDGGRESSVTSRDRLRGALVIAELGLVQVLLVGAGLLIRSQILVQSVPVGFDTHNLLVTSLTLPSSRYPNEAAVDAAFRQIESGIATIPGVKSVGRSQVVPIYGGGWNWTAMRMGSNGHDALSVTSDMRAVSPTYFQALGLPLLRGRPFTAGDGPGSAEVAIVSRLLAKRLFGNADPVGQMISNGSVGKPGWKQIVGVVDDVHADGQAQEAPLTMYMPSATWVNGGQSLIIRGTVPVVSLVPQLRRAVAAVDPLLALSATSTMDDALGRTLAVPRFSTRLLTLLGLTGLVLAIVGVYGIISYFVAQRTHELGVRIALGASAGSVQWLVVRQGLLLAGIGIAFGLALSLSASRFLSSMIFGVTPHDPMTFAAVAGILVVVATAASLIPARRATRVDPLEALRS